MFSKTMWNMSTEWRCENKRFRLSNIDLMRQLHQYVDWWMGFGAARRGNSTTHTAPPTSFVMQIQSADLFIRIDVEAVFGTAWRWRRWIHIEYFGEKSFDLFKIFPINNTCSGRDGCLCFVCFGRESHKRWRRWVKRRPKNVKTGRQTKWEIFEGLYWKQLIYASGEL